MGGASPDVLRINAEQLKGCSRMICLAQSRVRALTCIDPSLGVGVRSVLDSESRV